MSMPGKLLVLAVSLLALSAGAAGATRDKPDQVTHSKAYVSNLIVETSACPGFSGTSPLRFSGKLFAAYRVWNAGSLAESTEEGFAFVNVTASDGKHSYRITQLYLFPRQYREYVYGWARTWVVRDDRAMMTGASTLGVQPEYPGGGAEGIWWSATPTCVAPRH
jgi:hypothetical protein